MDATPTRPSVSLQAYRMPGFMLAALLLAGWA